MTDRGRLLCKLGKGGLGRANALVLDTILPARAARSVDRVKGMDLSEVGCERFDNLLASIFVEVVAEALKDGLEHDLPIEVRSRWLLLINRLCSGKLILGDVRHLPRRISDLNVALGSLSVSEVVKAEHVSSVNRGRSLRNLVGVDLLGPAELEDPVS